MKKSFLFGLMVSFILITGCTKDSTVFKKKTAIVDKGSVSFNGKSAAQTVKDMKTGWNLGNTMDATSDTTLNSEISWSQPYTTKAMIDSLAASGIKTIRIPVSWHNHIIDTKYTIDPQWMTRVKEIVDWAISQDMYVILNSHHDCWESPLEMPPCSGYYPNLKNLEESKRYLNNIWAQISLAFNNGYDEHLIFETMNEPRLRGTENEWWNDKNSQTYYDAAKALNEMNQIALDTIRKSGGNNQNRYVMIPGLRAAADSAYATEFKMPADDAAGKLILSVHLYDPYAFAMDGKGITDFTVDHKKALSLTFKSLNYNYVSKGIPVVIGEYGATNKNNPEDRVEWFQYFIKNSRKYGMTACLWDNGIFEGSNEEGERFGFFNREEGTWYYPEILQAILTAVSE